MTVNCAIHILALVSLAASETCSWTVCQEDTAAVRCARHGVERARESCVVGIKYECCSVGSTDTESPVAGDPSPREARAHDGDDKTDGPQTGIFFGGQIRTNVSRIRSRRGLPAVAVLGRLFLLLTGSMAAAAGAASKNPSQPRYRPPDEDPSDEDEDEDDGRRCPRLEIRNIIKLRGQFPCGDKKLGETCDFECMPGFDEQPKYRLRCVESNNGLRWDAQNIRCEQETCRNDGYIVLRTPSPKLSHERKVTAMVIKYDLGRRIPFWSVAMFQGDEFGTLDYTHLAGSRHGSFLKHHCPSLADAQANDEAYANTGLDRGHLTPAQAVRWSPKASRSVNLYINVAPQDRSVNGKIWRPIESQTYRFARRMRTLVATGTCTHAIAWLNNIAVPYCFWKMICYRDGNRMHQVVGFIADNTELPRNRIEQRKRQSFTPRSQQEVLHHAGIGFSPFAEAAGDVMRGREELVIAPGRDSVDTIDPYSCAEAMSLPRVIEEHWADVSFTD